eukprot:tig00000144_g9106.t1
MRDNVAGADVEAQKWLHPPKQAKRKKDQQQVPITRFFAPKSATPTRSTTGSPSGTPSGSVAPAPSPSGPRTRGDSSGATAAAEATPQRESLTSPLALIREDTLSPPDRDATKKLAIPPAADEEQLRTKRARLAGEENDEAEEVEPSAPIAVRLRNAAPPPAPEPCEPLESSRSRGSLTDEGEEGVAPSQPDEDSSQGWERIRDGAAAAARAAAAAAAADDNSKEEEEGEEEGLAWTRILGEVAAAASNPAPAPAAAPIQPPTRGPAAAPCDPGAEEQCPEPEAEASRDAAPLASPGLSCGYSGSQIVRQRSPLLANGATPHPPLTSARPCQVYETQL